MKSLKILLILVLCLLIAAPAFAADNLPKLSVKDSAMKDDGVVRVYLRSLSSPRSVTLKLAGEYMAKHDPQLRFERGTELALSAVDGKIYMSVGGLIMEIGSAVTLTRRAAAEDAEENGIYIKESEREALYPGDLHVSVNDDGGLRLVLHLNVEDYLLGVIAYEMSDSWPLDALKAQAVAARTYVMQRKAANQTRDYDVVDTTGDQVFKGVDASFTNVAQAVEETYGIVGTYKGSYATCYYTASNGGETSLVTDVWGYDGDYGYLDRRADPYDLENSYSITKSVTFSPDLSDAVTLRDLLQKKLDTMEFGVGLRVASVTAIEPALPVADGSIMYQKLRFTVTCSGMVDAYAAPVGDPTYIPAATSSTPANSALRALVYLQRLLSETPFVPSEARTALEDSFLIELDVYEDIKEGLGLSINAGNYEIVSVDQADGMFTINMRRFGHGVGMSQRGAQMMAGRHELSYLQILGFYYPGITLEKIKWDTPELNAPDALPNGVETMIVAPTPTPTPGPLPELKDGEYYAVVTLHDAGVPLNIRQKPSTSSTILDKFPEGRRVIVCSEADENGWVAIRTAELEGFVKLEYLTKE